jgi:large subunit ribosomal protein L21
MLKGKTFLQSVISNSLRPSLVGAPKISALSLAQGFGGAYSNAVARPFSDFFRKRDY